MVEKRLQKQFGIQWAWADSIAKEAQQCFEQLKTAKMNEESKVYNEMLSHLSTPMDENPRGNPNPPVVGGTSTFFASRHWNG